MEPLSAAHKAEISRQVGVIPTSEWAADAFDLAGLEAARAGRCQRLQPWAGLGSKLGEHPRGARHFVRHVRVCSFRVSILIQIAG